MPGSLSIEREAVPSRPFSVVGPRGAVFGQQDGSFELWLFPWKVLSDLRISAQMDSYPVPIDLNQHAAWIEVRPDSTIITFSHANFTVREIVLAPRQAPDGAGALVLFQIEAVRPMTMTFSFTPNMRRMWPAESDDCPFPEWIGTGASSGFYILHLNFPDHGAAIAMPTAEPGVVEPYQERAASYPLQFVLRFDPVLDAHALFPLLVALGNTEATSTKEAFAQQLIALNRSIQSIYDENESYYMKLLASCMRIETPDSQLNDAFSWAEASVDHLRAETTPGTATELVVQAIHAPAGMHLASQAPGARIQATVLRIPLPDVEVVIASHLPEFGAETRQLKVLDQQMSARHRTPTFAGIGGATCELLLPENAANLGVHADSATLGALNRGLRTFTDEFPNAPGYATKTITFSS